MDAADTPVIAPPLELGATSQQIPAGIRLKLNFLTPLDSQTTNSGDEFLAESAEDLWLGQQLILPKGTLIRGRTEDVKRPGFFSKGGLIRLTFDHVVMPSGELKPLNLEVDAATEMLDTTRDGLYTDPGMGAKLSDSVDKGVDKFKFFRDRGVKAGQERGGGINMLLTVPTNAIAGVASGTAITTVNAAKAVFGKGESVVIQPGDTLVIDFSKATTLPSQ